MNGKEKEEQHFHDTEHSWCYNEVYQSNAMQLYVLNHVLAPPLAISQLSAADIELGFLSYHCFVCCQQKSHHNHNKKCPNIDSVAHPLICSQFAVPSSECILRVRSRVRHIV
jgi:hypothetical protein